MAGLPIQFSAAMGPEVPPVGQESGGRSGTSLIIIISFEKASSPTGVFRFFQRPSLGKGVFPQRKLTSSTISTQITRLLSRALANANCSAFAAQGLVTELASSEFVRAISSPVRTRLN